MVPAGPDAYLETSVTVPNEVIELVCDFIVENITNGLVLEEEEGAGVTTVLFYVADDTGDAADKLRGYLRKLGDGSKEAPEVRQRRIANIEWIDKYKESIRPLEIGGDIVVRPTWASPTGATYEIIIEPKLAFGTGSHATTRSSLLAVREHVKSTHRFLDMGCGSGILSILADKLGATYIKAVDYDPEATENCRENFDINAVAAEHTIMLGSLEQCDGDAPYDCVAANIIRSTILSMIDRLVELTRSGGMLILSGLLQEDEPAISAALAERRQTEYSIRRDEQWLTYSVRRR